MGDRVTVILVHVSQNLGLGGRKSASTRCKQKIGAVDPIDSAEAGDEMAALHGNPKESKVAKAGVEGACRVMRDKAGEEPRVIGRQSLSEQRQARSGQRVGAAFGAVKQ